jgi:hypothetical protein
MNRILTMPRLSLTRHAFAVAILFLLSISAVYAQTSTPPRQLLELMINALGGQQFLNVKEIQTKGRFFTFKRNEISMSDVYVSFTKFPDMDRLELGREKQKQIRINKGLEGWSVTPGKGKEPEVTAQSVSDGEKFLKDFRTKFDYVVRFVVNTPRATLVNAGGESVDNRRADVLEIRDAEKNLTRIFIDRETRFPLKVQTRLVNESTLYEEVFANWHKYDGVMTPLTVIRFKDGVKIDQMHVEMASYNPGFPDSLFAPPVKTK